MSEPENWVSHWDVETCTICGALIWTVGRNTHYDWHDAQPVEEDA